MRDSSDYPRRDLIGYVYILPAIIFLCVFVGYPAAKNIILSFQNVDVMTLANPVKEFIGIDNYTTVIKDADFTKSLGNTFIFTIGTMFFQFIIGFAFALFFKGKFSFAKPLRGFLMIAWVMPLTVTSLMFKFMFGTDGGIINQILMSVHVISQPVEWLTQPASAMWALIITNTWVGIPFNMILLTTGLMTIPSDVYEGADIDGANTMQKFFRITLPLLKPSILSVITLGFIYTFKVFDIVMVITQGGPINATEMLSTYSYKQSFVQFNFSKGAAAANILFLILAVVGLFYIKLIQKEEVT